MIKSNMFDQVVNWLFLILVEVLEISNNFGIGSAAWVILITVKPDRDRDSITEWNSYKGLGVQIGGVLKKFYKSYVLWSMGYYLFVSKKK